MKIAIHAAFFFEIPKYSKKALNISWMKIVEATILYLLYHFHKTLIRQISVRLMMYVKILANQKNEYNKLLLSRFNCIFNLVDMITSKNIKAIKKKVT